VTRIAGERIFLDFDLQFCHGVNRSPLCVTYVTLEWSLETRIKRAGRLVGRLAALS
jgi:hypothetical protein